jgi:hypothetical protein
MTVRGTFHATRLAFATTTDLLLLNFQENFECLKKS